MIDRRLRAILAQAGALVLGGAVFLVTPARGAEPAPAPDNGFTCRASAVRTENSSIEAANIEPFTANEEGGACRSESTGLIGPAAPVPLPGGLGTVRAAYAETDDATNSAESGVADIDLTLPGGHTVSADVLQSQASAGACAAPALTGSSTVLSVTVDGTTVTVPAEDAGAPLEVPLAGLGTLFLNYQDGPDAGAADQVLTQRALFLDVDQAVLPLVPDVIVAEAIADIHGDPCAPPVVDEGRCPAPSPEGQDATPDKDCGFGKPSNVDEAPKGGRKK